MSWGRSEVLDQTMEWTERAVVKSKRHAWGWVVRWVVAAAVGRERCTSRCSWRRDRLWRGPGDGPSCMMGPWSRPNTRLAVVKSKRHAWDAVLIWVGGWAGVVRKRCTYRCNWTRDRLRKGRGDGPSCLTGQWSGRNTMWAVVKSKGHAWGWCAHLGGCSGSGAKKVYRSMQLEA